MTERKSKAPAAGADARLSEASSFRLGQYDDFLAPDRSRRLFRTSPQQLVFLFLFLCADKGKRKALRLGLMFSFCFARCLWIGFCRLYFHAISNKALPNA